MSAGLEAVLASKAGPAGGVMPAAQGSRRHLRSGGAQDWRARRQLETLASPGGRYAVAPDDPLASTARTT